jgi:hypothetical protein
MLSPPCFVCLFVCLFGLGADHHMHQKGVGRRADVWSLGCTGMPPPLCHYFYSLFDVLILMLITEFSNDACADADLGEMFSDRDGNGSCTI